MVLLLLVQTLRRYQWCTRSGCSGHQCCCHRCRTDGLGRRRRRRGRLRKGRCWRRLCRPENTRSDIIYDSVGCALRRQKRQEQLARFPPEGWKVDDVAVGLQEEPLGHVVFVSFGDRLEPDLPPTDQTAPSIGLVAVSVSRVHVQLQLLPGGTW